MANIAKGRSGSLPSLCTACLSRPARERIALIANKEWCEATVNETLLYYLSGDWLALYVRHTEKRLSKISKLRLVVVFFMPDDFP
jgi:hypothetical protein